MAEGDNTNIKDQLSKVLSGNDKTKIEQLGGVDKIKEALSNLEKGGDKATTTINKLSEANKKAGGGLLSFASTTTRAHAVVDGLSSAMSGLNSAFGSGGVQMTHFIDASSKLFQVLGGSNKATQALEKAFKGMGHEALYLSDSMAEMYKGFAQVSLASTDLESVLGDAGGASEKMFATYREGVSTVAQTTGRSIQTIQREYQELYKTSQFVADGFDLQSDAATRTQKTFEAYQKGVQLARATGLEFSDVSSVMSDLFRTQGIRSDEAQQSIAMLKKGIEGTTLSMPSAVTILKDMASTFRDVSVSGRDMAAAIGFAAKQQTVLAAESKYTYRTSEEAASGMARALGGVVKAQKDWGESIFYTSLAGGGMEQAFDFMFAQPGEAGYKSPMEQSKMMMQGIGSMFGGDILTREEARDQGRTGEFMAQTQMIQQAYGLQSPQEAARFAGLMEKAAEGDTTAFDEMNRIQQESQTALSDILKSDEKHFNKLYTSSEVGNVLLTKIATSVGGFTRGAVSGLQRAAIGGGIGPTPSQEEIEKLSGIQKETLERLKKEGTISGSSPKPSITPTPITPADRKSTALPDYESKYEQALKQSKTTAEQIRASATYATNKLAATAKGYVDVNEQALTKAWQEKITHDKLKFKTDKEQKEALKKFTEEYIAKEKTREKSTTIGGTEIGYTATGLQQTQELGKSVMWKGSTPGETSTEAFTQGLEALDVDKTKQLNLVGKAGYGTATGITQAQQVQKAVMDNTKAPEPTIAAGTPSVTAPTTAAEAPNQPITIPIQLTLDGKVVAQTTVDYIIRSHALDNTYLPKSKAQGQVAKPT